MAKLQIKENHNIEFKQSWGRGIDKIIHESEKFNDITPKFRLDNGLWVEFNFNMPEKMAGKMAGKIIEVIRRNPSITIPEMSSAIGVSERTLARKLQSMQKEGKLKRVGGRKEGSWMIIEFKD